MVRGGRSAMRNPAAPIAISTSFSASRPGLRRRVKSRLIIERERQQLRVERRHQGRHAGGEEQRRERAADVALEQQGEHVVGLGGA